MSSRAGASMRSRSAKVSQHVAYERTLEEEYCTYIAACLDGSRPTLLDLIYPRLDGTLIRTADANSVLLHRRDQLAEPTTRDHFFCHGERDDVAEEVKQEVHSPDPATEDVVEPRFDRDEETILKEFLQCDIARHRLGGRPDRREQETSSLLHYSRICRI